MTKIRTHVLERKLPESIDDRISDLISTKSPAVALELYYDFLFLLKDAGISFKKPIFSETANLIYFRNGKSHKAFSLYVDPSNNRTLIYQNLNEAQLKLDESILIKFRPAKHCSELFGEVLLREIQEDALYPEKMSINFSDDTEFHYN